MINDSVLTRYFWQEGRSDQCPVIDIHCHMGNWPGIWLPSSTAEKMLQTMDQIGIRLICFSHHEALTCPEIANRTAIKTALSHSDRFRFYLSINPHYQEHYLHDLNDYDSYGNLCVGLKLHPSWHETPLNHLNYQKAWQFADERRLLVLSHTWSDSKYDGPDMVRQVAEKYVNTKFILGHSLHGSWDEAIKIAREFPHVYLDLTAVLDDRGIVESFIAAGLSQKILFGTDLPWFNPYHGIGALLSADISDDDRHNILHRNAEKLLSDSCYL